MKKAGKEKSFRITMVSELIKLFVAVRLLLIFPCELSSQSCPPPFALDGKKYWLCIYLMNPSLSPLCIFIICFCSKRWWAYGHWLVCGTSKSCESRLSRITNSLEVENGKWRNQVQVKESCCCVFNLLKCQRLDKGTVPHLQTIPLCRLWQINTPHTSDSSKEMWTWWVSSCASPGRVC